ncbi:MAG: redoxin domain-containing protein [Candidatus Marinimicrobia bacterium]|nr:redoxin domain-containing protein [Candidatus Neomarinimicrobiota bacterium]MCF7829731.1 redoxin domain-containing protein [Candidatus Neomarinimicrobiota bacterium]MCF7881681.1 redoxin domain-containing protein [Candidatus Neomarinimicrobiota bacterium]
MAEGGCARPTGARVGEAPREPEVEQATQPKEKTMKQAQVGKPAPDFEAPAYHNGEFTQTKLSDYLGSWTLLCFYPGDFTYV